MLEQVDLTLTLAKSEYREHLTPLGHRLNALQRRCHAAGLPIVLVFEGFDAAGRASTINRLIREIDPRAFQVHTIERPNEEERLRPFLWRFAVRLPHRGYMAIFHGSWYRRVLAEQVEGKVGPPALRDAHEEIAAFERQLVDAGYVLVKFWFHISQREQRQRFRRMSRDQCESWKITPNLWRRNARHGDYVQAMESVLARNAQPRAPWVIVEAEDPCFARRKTLETVARAMETALARHEAQAAAPPALGLHVDPAQYRSTVIESESFLARFDLGLRVERDDYRKQLDRLQEQAREAHHRMYLKRVAAVIVFEGWDAAGKGGAIRRLIAPLDPRGFEVVPICAPTREELDHHYLWRFWRRIPKSGHLTIYDRSWYGRVLVERVEGLCTTEEWQRAYREINEFERQLIGAGIVLVKFWHQIDRDEQLRRFRDREATPHKAWKIGPEDWRNRGKWEDYELAVADMIQRTSTPNAPWTVVESNCKLHSRLKVLRTFVEAVSAKLGCCAVAAGGS